MTGKNQIWKRGGGGGGGESENSLNNIILGRVKGKDPLKHMRTARAQASLRIGVVSPEPMPFIYVSDKPTVNFSQRTRHVALLWGRACTLKDWFDGKPEVPFSRGMGRIMIVRFGRQFRTHITQFERGLHYMALPRVNTTFFMLIQA